MRTLFSHTDRSHRATQSKVTSQPRDTYRSVILSAAKDLLLKTSLRALALALVALSTAALAQNITGTVTNATAGKPAANIDVTLVDPMGGMAEVGRAKTDAQGRFSLQASSPAQGPRLVRASKDGVNYFKMLPPGTASADLSVYDAAKKVDGITTTVDVIRLQTGNGALQVMELYAVQNSSNPPKTLASNGTFEIVLPEGANIDTADAQGPNGQPITSMPEALKQKGHYAFSYPLKPGETRFQIAYHLPYSGQMSFKPQALMPLQHFVVMLPASMQWKPANAAQFQPMQDQPGTNVQVVSNAQPGQDLSFTVSGTGTIPENNQQTAQGDMGGGSAPDNTARPGGGLGPPIDAPDPLQKYRWWILGALAVILCGGALLTLRRGSTRALEVEDEPMAKSPSQFAARTEAPVIAHQQVSKPSLLDVMKEELFQLELDRQAGTITAEEYARHKEALDQTLARALARQTQSKGA